MVASETDGEEQRELGARHIAMIVHD